LRTVLVDAYDGARVAPYVQRILLTAAIACMARLALPSDGKGLAERTDYAGQPGCPDSAAFLSMVRTRASQAFEPSPSARRFRVVLQTTPDGALGEITIVEPDGREAARTLTGKTCAEVANAVSLIMVVLDGSSDRPEPKPALRAEPPLPPPTASAPPPADRTPPAVAPPWRGAIGTQVTLSRGLSPRWVVGPRLFVELTSQSSDLFAPSLRLSFAYANTGTLETEGGAASLGWSYGRAELCPVTLRHASGFALRPCWFFDAGTLIGSPEPGTPSPSPGALFWLAPGMAARAAFPLARWLGLEAEGDLFFPIDPPRFYFEPDRTLYRVPQVGGSLGGGAFVSFP
jgi:hypothetical protein